jgi:surface polysaccharide O-acyltransferase-like enzyme
VDDYLSKKIKVLTFSMIIMVVFLHAYNLPVDRQAPGFSSFNHFIQLFISQGITRIAVPMFFSISGYLFFVNYTGRSDYYKKITKRFKGLFLPYVMWSLAGLLFYYFLNTSPLLKSYFNQNLFTGVTAWGYCKLVFLDPIPFQLWFVRDLFLLALISPLIFVLISKFSLAFMLSLGTCWFYDINPPQFANLNWPFLRIEGILFFSLGATLALKKINLGGKCTPNITLLIVWIALVVAKVFYAGINLTVPIHKISIITGLVAVWLNYELLVFLFDRKSIFKLTSYTFFVFLFHEPFLTMVEKVFEKILHFPSIAIYLTAPLLTICMAFLIASLLTKRLPRVYNIITGGRSIGK